MAYRQQYVTCGKARCRCMKPNGAAHGPYWYEFSRVNGRCKSRYIGKKLPRGAGRRSEHGSGPRVAFADQWDADILGVDTMVDQATAKRVFRRLVMQHHPDRGGSTRKMAEINAAWSRFCGRRGWI